MSLDFKGSIYRVSDHLQSILGYMEIEEYDKALSHLHDTIRETAQLAKELSKRSTMHELIGLDALEQLRLEAKQVQLEAKQVQQGMN
jgi:hypothetical protein